MNTRLRNMLHLNGPGVLRWFTFFLILSHLGSSYAETPVGCDGAMDVTFLLDSSESMIENDPFGKPYYNWGIVKNFTKQVIKRLPVGDSAGDTSVALLQYADIPRHVFYLNDKLDVYTMSDRIDSIKHTGGYTYTSLALQYAGKALEASAKQRKVVVVVSDGLSNYDVNLTIPEADKLKKEKMELYAIGVTKYIDEEELKQLASNPDSKYFLNLEDFSIFDYYVDQLVHRLCNLPDPAPPTSNVPGCPSDCAYCTENKVCVNCVPGKYLGETGCLDCIEHCSVCRGPNSCDLCQLNYYWSDQEKHCQLCEIVTDMAILVDNSGSINDKGADNYDKLKSFLASIVNTLDIGSNKTRIAALRFSDQSYIEFYLNEYFTREGINDAIRRMGYEGSHTNIAQAIRRARNEIFVESKGDRPDVRNVALLITDGESTRELNHTDYEAEEARKAGILMFVVGVTNEINIKELHSVASQPVEDHYFNASDIAALEKIFQALVKQVCTRRIQKRSLHCETNDEQCHAQDEPDAAPADLPSSKKSSGMSSVSLSNQMSLYIFAAVLISVLGLVHYVPVRFT